MCMGRVTGPDRPWLKGEDKLLNKWKTSGAVLQVVGYKGVIKIPVASHLLQSTYGISGSFGRKSQAMFHTWFLRRFKIFSSTTYTLFFFFFNTVSK